MECIKAPFAERGVWRVLVELVVELCFSAKKPEFLVMETGVESFAISELMSM